LSDKHHNALSERYSDGDYIDKNSTWHVEDSPWKARKIIRLLDENGVMPSTVAEVGCGAGEILINLSEHFASSEFSGYELSPIAYDICRKKSRSRVKFYNSDVGKVLRKFDVILCIDVFEHVDDYIGFLKNIAPLADHHVFHIPLEISVKTVLSDGLMRQRNAVGHLHYFSAETALATLKDAGYQILAWQFTAPFEHGGVAAVSGKAKVANFFRRIFYKASPLLLSRTLGGCSLLALCIPEVGAINRAGKCSEGGRRV
jgi:SAM-dependent methyltransferase